MLPHPFPYQGSKRKIAGQILQFFPAGVNTLFEPFCGSAAISIAAMSDGLINRVALNDLNRPLMLLWEEILLHPERLASAYEELWFENQPDEKDIFNQVREQFNLHYQPHHLLYLLARIVKGSVRYNHEGAFNQSADNRRRGMRPGTMRQNIAAVSRLLRNSTVLSSVDFEVAIEKADVKDLIYMDPPYQGTSGLKDHRYYSGVEFDKFTAALSLLNEKNISYIVSYDGATGDKKHGSDLPERLQLKHLFINAGRSTQLTLLGKAEETIESLYLSAALVERLSGEKRGGSDKKQLQLMFA